MAKSQNSVPRCSYWTLQNIQFTKWTHCIMAIALTGHCKPQLWIQTQMHNYARNSFTVGFTTKLFCQGCISISNFTNGSGRCLSVNWCVTILCWMNAVQEKLSSICLIEFVPFKDSIMKSWTTFKTAQLCLLDTKEGINN